MTCLPCKIEQVILILDETYHGAWFSHITGDHRDAIANILNIKMIAAMKRDQTIDQRDLGTESDEATCEVRADKNMEGTMKRKKSNYAFSLIELLVVMAVILTLLGLLMPSLQGVRERAYQTVCASNLRQIGVAIAAYLGDSEGWYPLSGGCWHGSARHDFLQWGGCGNNGMFDNRSAIWPYIPSKAVFLCPMDSKNPIYRHGLSYGITDQTHYNNSAQNVVGVNRRDVLNGELSRYAYAMSTIRLSTTKMATP